MGDNNVKRFKLINLLVTYKDYIEQLSVIPSFYEQGMQYFVFCICLCLLLKEKLIYSSIIHITTNLSVELSSSKSLLFTRKPNTFDKFTFFIKEYFENPSSNIAVYKNISKECVGY